MCVCKRLPVQLILTELMLILSLPCVAQGMKDEFYQQMHTAGGVAAFRLCAHLDVDIFPADNSSH